MATPAKKAEAIDQIKLSFLIAKRKK